MSAGAVGEGGRAVNVVRPAWRGLLVVLVAIGALLTGLSARYGYHRDELYFLAAGHHLAWGYPDQGPLVPVLWRVGDELGGSMVVERIPATICLLGTALFGGLIAVELGGRWLAQVLTALVVGAAPFVLGTGHLLLTSTVDVFVWTVVCWCVAHVVRSGRQRWWLLAGLVAGVGLLNKDLPAVLLLAVLVGLVAVPQTRRQLRSPWLWLGGVLAALLWLPNLLWQAGHGWPQLILSAEIHREYARPGERVGFAVEQLLLYSPVGLVLWVTGAVSLWRGRTASRVFCWIWLVCLAVFVVSAGQGYYTAGTYPPLIATGAVAAERLRRPLLLSRPVLLIGLAVAGTLTVLPAFLPVLPARTLAHSGWAGLAENQLETVGWPALVDQVATQYDHLPAAQRARTTILTANYGEAGAIARYGPARGLPEPFSGHNAFGLWGPPPERDTSVLAVWEDGPPDQLPACHRLAAVHNAEGVSNEESTRAALYLCAAPVRGWAAAWSAIVHLDS